MNNREEPERIMERRIMELQIQLAHSISEKELLELAAKLEEIAFIILSARSQYILCTSVF